MSETKFFGDWKSGYEVVLYDDLNMVKVFLDGTWYTGKFRNNRVSRFTYRSAYRSRNGNLFYRKLRVRLETVLINELADYVEHYTKLKVLREPYKVGA